MIGNDNLPIGALTSRRFKNGTPLYELKCFKDLDLLRKFAAGKEKDNLPAIFVHSGNRGEYKPTNWLFIDIDTTEHADELIEKSDELFLKIPNIKYIQKSFSGKLHLICKLRDVQEDGLKWNYTGKIITLTVLTLIKNNFNIDYFNALDFHQFGWTQPLYVSNNDIIENESCFPITITKDDEAKLKEQFSEYFPNKSEYKEKKVEGNFIENENDEVLTVDKTLAVGEYSGNDLRFRIGSCLLKILGDKAKAENFIERHFKNHSEIKVYDYGYDETVGTWLLAKFFKNDKSHEGIEVEQYITEKYDLVKDIISKENRILIKADTGMGKTTLMRMLADELNAVIIVPFNSMLSLYNTDRIVNDRKLPALVEISSTSSNIYTDTKPCVMIWDQAMKYDLKDRWVISDETHQWFNDREYREAAVKTINMAKQWNHLICISATPAGEIEELNLKCYNFYKKDTRKIKTNFLETYQPDVLMKNIIEHSTQKTIVFSDMYARRLYENFPEGLLLHSDRKNTDEFQTTIKEELIKNDLAFCTSLAFNGLNFNNTEPINAVVCVKEGDNTANNIIQAVGRFRKSENITLSIVFTPTREGNDRQSLEEKTKDAEIIKNLTESQQGKDLDLNYDTRLTDANWHEALTKIEEYKIQHSSKEQMLMDLNSAGKFDITTFPFITFKGEKRLERVIKKAESTQLKNAIIEGKTIEDKSQFQIDMIHSKNLLDEQCYINWSEILSLYKTDALIDNIISEVRFIINIAKLDDAAFNNAYDYSKIEYIAQQGASHKLLGNVKRKFDKAHKLRNEWRIRFNDREKPIEEIITDFLGIAVEIKSQQKEKGDLERIKGNIIGGKNRAQKIIIKNTVTGEIKEFDSKGDCMDFLRVSSKTFSKFIKGEPTRLKWENIHF